MTARIVKHVLCEFPGQTPATARNEPEVTVKLPQFFASQPGSPANQILVRQQTVEPARIARARQFIEERYREKLSLAAAAGHASMSVFYFCKMFRQVTGVRFTHYVSCLRVAEAKKLLLSPDYRITEIAYEVGFQSLTHFNRIFRRITGESPTQYRRHLSNA